MSMVHLSFGMKSPASPHLKSECAILAGMARATLPASATPWESYIGDYDRIRDVMAKVLDGFEDFNRRARRPLGHGTIAGHRDEQQFRRGQPVRFHA